MPVASLLRTAARAAAIVVGTAAVAALARPSPAAAQELDLGVRGGTVWSHLTAPRDPRGAPTLMDGRSFSGVGSTTGGAVALLYPIKPALSVGGELDVLYARQYASATEEAPDSGARRTTTFGADVLRIPLLATLQLSTPAGRWSVGLGPEYWTTLATGAQVDLVGVPQIPLPLGTTGASHVLVDASLRYSLPLAVDWSIPLELRVAWDPWIAPTTVGRFEGWQTRERPGRYQVAFDWHAMLLTGLTWRTGWE